MDANEYLLADLVRQRLEARQAAARRAELLAAARPPHRAGGWRRALGHALMRLGRALANEPAPSVRHA